MSISGSYGQSRNIQAIQSQIFEYINSHYSISGDMDLKLGKAGFFRSGLNYFKSRNRVENEAESPEPIRGISQNLQFDLLLTKKLIANLYYNYVYNSAVIGGNKTMQFADAAFKYNLTKVQFLLEYNNIFNTKRYVTSYFNLINSFYTSYDLRPTQVLLKVRFKIK